MPFASHLHFYLKLGQECLWMVEKLNTTYKDIHKLSKKQNENLMFKQNMTNAP
jgi:hypothetical protein